MIRIVQAVGAICVVAMTLTAETRQSKALELNLAKAWRSVDTSAAPSCSSRPVTVDTDSGTLRIRGDTLAFYRREPRIGMLLTQRGVLRRDTLRAGALLFDGPALVYVKVR